MTREQVVRALDRLAVVMETATIVGPALNDKGPMIYVITGLLGLGLHSAAVWVRKR